MERKFVCTTDFPLVETKYGTLHGYQMDDICIFHGIQYAKAKRFQMPEEPDSWQGVKDALTYGHVSPYNPVAGSPEVSLPLRYWPMNENCQFLNIWTPTLESSAKRRCCSGFMVADMVRAHRWSNCILTVKTSHGTGMLLS